MSPFFAGKSQKQSNYDKSLPNEKKTPVMIKNLEKWAADWGMRFNAKKCYILTITDKGMHKFYSTLVYGATIWDPHMEKDVIKLEKIQRKALRFIKNDYRFKTPGSLTNMQEELKLPVLKQRRKEKR